MAGSKVTGTASAGLGTAGGWQKGQVATASRLAWGRSGAAGGPEHRGGERKTPARGPEQLLREQPRPGRSAGLGGSNKSCLKCVSQFPGPVRGWGAMRAAPWLEGGTAPSSGDLGPSFVKIFFSPKETRIDCAIECKITVSFPDATQDFKDLLLAVTLC